MTFLCDVDNESFTEEELDKDTTNYAKLPSLEVPTQIDGDDDGEEVIEGIGSIRAWLPQKWATII